MLLIASYANTNAQSVNLTKGLIGYWNFDDSTANDNSGNNLNGTPIGNPAVVQGIKGNCFSFNGTSQYVDFGNDSMLNLGRDRETTISLWYQATDSNVKNVGNGFRIRPIVAKESGSSTKTDYLLFIENQFDSKGSMIKWGTAPHNASYPANWMETPEPSRNNWHHLAVTFKPQISGGKYYYTKEIYIDCQLVAKDSSSFKNDVNTKSLRIGHSFTDDAKASIYFQGMIDEFRIYNRALNENEIKTLGFCLPSAYSISGKTFSNDSLAMANTKVYLLKYTPNDTLIHVMDSTLSNTNGAYQFNNLTSDSYYLAIEPDMSVYANQIPTHYNRQMSFAVSDMIVLLGNDRKIDLYSLYSTNTNTGLGIINGKIYYCSLCKKGGSGNPAKNVKIYLIDDKDETIVGYTKTDNDGAFAFKNLPNNKYRVYVDRPAVTNKTYPTFTINNGAKTNGVYTLYPTYLEQELFTGIDNQNNTKNGVAIYPNPATQIVNINGSYSSLIIQDLGGRVISYQVNKQEIGTTQIDISKFNSGVYLLNIDNTKYKLIKN